MAKIWEPLTIETYQSWTTTITMEAEEEFTDWEKTFIDSINNQLDGGRNLSQKQAEILERIYAEKT